ALETAESLLQSVYGAEQVVVLRFHAVEAFFHAEQARFHARQADLDELELHLQVIPLVQERILHAEDGLAHPLLGLGQDPVKVGEEDLAMELRENGDGDRLVGHRAHPSHSFPKAAGGESGARLQAGRGERPAGTIYITTWRGCTMAAQPPFSEERDS